MQCSLRFAICIAYLIFRSTFVPRVIGFLMAVDGVAYLVYSFADLLAPGFADNLVPWIQLPAFISEGSLCLWLLVVGVDVDRWTAPARAPGNPFKVHINRGSRSSGSTMRATSSAVSAHGSSRQRRNDDRPDPPCPSHTSAAAGGDPLPALAEEAEALGRRR